MKKDKSQTEINKVSSLLRSFDREIGEDVFRTEYSTIIAKVDQIDAQNKAKLLAVCVAALGDEYLAKQNEVRISSVRVLVPLLPLSLEFVSNLLSNFSSLHDYEIHYTLFCYLDWVQEMNDASTLTKQVLLLIENYLMKVQAKTARAVWMAGDMLGNHWNEQEATPLLIRTAQNAKYAIGRQGSILGLEKILERSPDSDTSKYVRETLLKISLVDRSLRVQEESKLLLNKRFEEITRLSYRLIK